MSLENKLTKTASEMASSMWGSSIPSLKEVISLIDLTQLDIYSTPNEIQDLAVKANLNQVAAICVLPYHLDFISPDLTLKRATVMNFPTGTQAHQHVLETIEQTATLKAVDEIDYVFPYAMYLAGKQPAALSYCHEAFQLCKQYKLTFKVILETGALPSMDAIYDLSKAVIQTGCDFLKTSTGKINHGASIPAVFSMLSALVDSNASCGIKVSGGVKTTEQALTYMHLARYMLNRELDSTCFRLGASGLLDELIKQQGTPHQ